MTSKVAQLDVWMITLRLKEPFRFAYGTLYQIPRVLIRLAVDDLSGAFVGWGEAAIDFPFVNYDMFDVYDELVKLKTIIQGVSLDDQYRLVQSEETITVSFPAALCALNMALDDAWGKKHRSSSTALYGTQRSNGTPLCSLGFDQSTDPLSWASATGVVKLKLGRSLSMDLTTIEVAEQLADRTRKRYALDFNAKYSLPEMAELIMRASLMSPLKHCVFFEQALNCKSTVAEWQRLVDLLKQRLPSVALVADESFTSAIVGVRLASVGVALNYKIQKFGGIASVTRIDSTIKSSWPLLRSFVGGTFPSPLGRAYDFVAARVINSADLPGDGLLPASTYLTAASIEPFLQNPGIGIAVEPDLRKLSKAVIEDPREEYSRLREGRTPQHLEIDSAQGYSERYTALSGREALWNIRQHPASQ